MKHTEANIVGKDAKWKLAHTPSQQPSTNKRPAGKKRKEKQHGKATASA